MPDIDWGKAVKQNPVSWISGLFPVVKDNIDENREYFYERDCVKIKYSKNVTPDYFIKKQTTHDGTLIFVHWALRELFGPLLGGASFSTSNAPENYVDNYEDYDVEYTIGDLLWHSEPVDHVSEAQGKMFRGIRDNFSLPVAIKYIKRTPVAQTP